MVESFPWLHRGVGTGNLGASSGPTGVGGRDNDVVRSSRLHRSISLTSGKGPVWS